MAAQIDLRDTLARALAGVFRQQRALAKAGKSRFGDWHGKVRQALQPVLAAMFLWGLKRSRKGKLPSGSIDAVASLAQERALWLARNINETTSDWLGEDRALDAVFGADRVATIVLTETSYASHQPVMVTAKARSERLKWRTAGSSCPECKSLNGKIVRPGQQFRSKGGIVVETPPAHPHCDCTLEIV